jgi:glucoamylase
VPERELAPGEPSGSAMPLVWAHSEYIKLLRSLTDGKVFDTPFVVSHRYLVKKTPARVRPWREDAPALAIPVGHALRLDLPEEAIVLYTRDGWATQAEVSTSDSGIGLHIAEIATEGMKADEKIEFTWRRASDDYWRGRNFVVRAI